MKFLLQIMGTYATHERFIAEHMIFMNFSVQVEGKYATYELMFWRKYEFNELFAPG